MAYDFTIRHSEDCDNTGSIGVYENAFVGACDCEFKAVEELRASLAAEKAAHEATKNRLARVEPLPEGDCDVFVLSDVEYDGLIRERDEAKQESARLREALEKISNMPWPESESPYAVIARKALSGCTCNMSGLATELWHQCERCAALAKAGGS